MCILKQQIYYGNYAFGKTIYFISKACTESEMLKIMSYIYLKFG